MDSSAEPSRGGVILIGAPTVPEIPKGGVGGIGIWALSLRRGGGVGGGGGRWLRGIVNAFCAFATEGAMPDHSAALERL